VKNGGDFSTAGFIKGSKQTTFQKNSQPTINHTPRFQFVTYRANVNAAGNQFDPTGSQIKPANLGENARARGIAARC